jgi:hypothetical protein
MHGTNMKVCAFLLSHFYTNTPRNCASWASQPQKSVTLLTCPGGRTTKSTKDMWRHWTKKNCNHNLHYRHNNKCMFTVNCIINKTCISTPLLLHYSPQSTLCLQYILPPNCCILHGQLSAATPQKSDSVFCHTFLSS